MFKITGNKYMDVEKDNCKTLKKVCICIILLYCSDFFFLFPKLTGTEILFIHRMKATAPTVVHPTDLKKVKLV